MSKFTPTAEDVTELHRRISASRPGLALSRSCVREILETYMFEKALFGRCLTDPLTGASQCPRQMPPTRTRPESPCPEPTT